MPAKKLSTRLKLRASTYILLMNVVLDARTATIACPKAFG